LQICDVEAQFLNNPHIFDDSRLINERGDNQHHCQLWVIPRNTFFVLRSFAETEIGVLNTAISHCLQELSGNTSIHYEALLDSNAWKEAIRTWRQTGNRGRFLTDINVYGPRDAREAVGKVFSKARLYFQHPYRCNGYNKYDNPHYLSFSNIAIPESPIVKSGRTLVYQTERPSKCNISEAFENLDQQEYVRQANIDSRVRTLLLRFVLPCYSLLPGYDLVLTSTTKPSERRRRFYNATRGRNCSLCLVTLETQSTNINSLLVSFLDHYIPANAVLNSSLLARRLTHSNMQL
jgi:hypothetical protein